MQVRITEKCMVILGCLLVIGVIFVITNGIEEANATSTSSKVALIAVTNSTNSNTYEIDKVNYLYDHLIDEGWDEDDITLLGPGTVTDNDGIANLTNIENGFEDLVDNNNTDKEVLIYISDNGIPENGVYNLYLTDYSINSTSINGYLANITFDELNFIVCGNQSGYAGDYIDTNDIVLVSSMLETQSYATDEFNITRSLNDIVADTNFDQEITFLEAAQREIVVMDTYTDQTPRIWS